MKRKGKKKQNRSTNRATAFSNDLQRSLNKHNKALGNKLGILCWHMNWPIPRLGQTIDVVGLRKDNDPSPLVLIEVELLREDPSSNVAKIWKWATGTGSRSKFVLIQAFSKAYRKKKYERRMLAEFLGERMANELRHATYVPLDLDYNPRPGGKVGAGRRCYHAKLLAQNLASRGQELRQALQK